ncbi:MAG TPA: nitrous oxide reductase accessory protein NosL [Chitinophagaceae bacterium]|jgi:copper chaperone NosL|nr:nitrous oxide reductase accessory protein NosL [Chitinophagaceae bacterium]
MNNHLSITSRILVAFASGALIAVYFLPAWRIDLFAPQYPEGLSMYIWINNITGDIDIINGLNHYIGMKHISINMFPEFKYLPYVVAFFIALGMAAAITGKRKLLFVYILLTIIGGIFVPYDLYRWGYAYGHDLDPRAPIQVPGLSYQPPVFGHKRLLNFDAYSFPDVAGWIVFAAGALAFLVWFVEWYHHRKAAKSAVSKTALPVIAGIFLAVFFSSCSTKPEPFAYGKDACYECKMGIVDPKFGGEVVTKKGKLYKFDDMHCMIKFLKSGEVNEGDIQQTVVINYDKANDFLDVKNAAFAVSDELKSPMGANAAGFSSKEAAQKGLAGKQGTILSWNELFEQIN